MKNLYKLLILSFLIISCVPSQVELISTPFALPSTPTFPSPLTATPEFKIYTLRIEYSTSSDWGELYIQDSGAILNARVVSKQGKLTNFSATKDFLSLNQTLENANASKQVGIIVDFDITNQALENPVDFLLNKGALNDAIIRFYNVIDGNVYFLQEVIRQGAVPGNANRNPYEFTFDLKILEATPSLTQLIPSPTLTLTPSPYNLSFEQDSNWVFNQRWQHFYSAYSTDWASSGDKSLKLFYENRSDSRCEINPWDRVEVSGEVDLTNANFIVYDVMPLNPILWERWHRSSRHVYPLGLEIQIDNHPVSVLSEVTGELRGQYIPVENFSGVHTLTFVFHPLQPRGCILDEFGIYLDNFRILNSDQFLDSLPLMPTPIPTFADVHTNILYYGEDFEDEEITGWSSIINGFRSYGSSWDIREDGYGNHYWQGAGDIQYPQVWYIKKDWTDYAFEVRFRDISPKEDGNIFICIRSSENGNSFYVAHIDVANDWYQLAVFDGSEYKNLKSGDQTFSKNQWYLARVEAQGNEVRLFIDNEMLATVIDDTLSEGTIGFYMASGNYLHIDDMRVWSLP